MAAEPAYDETPAPKPKGQLRQLPLFDGYTIDKFKVNFSGGVDLEKTVEADTRFVDEALIGRKVRLVIEGYVHASAGKAPRDKEGDISEVVKTVSIKVDSILLDQFEVIEPL